MRKLVTIAGRQVYVESRDPGMESYFTKEAAHTFVPQDHSGTGMMVAMAPPKDVVDSLHLNDPDAEPAHDLHVTMAYLGATTDHTPGQLRDLPEVIDSWAEGRKPIKMTVSGSGTFLAPDKDSPHVLHALVNSPGLHLMHAHLVNHLQRYGYDPKQTHGFVPHISLGYTKHDVRFLPKVSRKSWVAKDVWSAIGDKRRSHPFGG